MKNVTVRVDEGVLNVARKYAASRDLTLKGLIRGYLNFIAEREARASAARQRIKKLNPFVGGKC
jgi:hypothetical protein